VNDGPVPWGYEPDDKVIVGCVSFSQRNMRLVPGNREGRCAECGRRIVVGPQARAMAERSDVELWTVCIRCLQKHAPGAKALPVPGAVDELVRQGVDRLEAEDAARRMGEIPIAELDRDLLDGRGG
jgi:DNA-directed RNA polymerase subunit RPC12/RpoP